MYKSLILTTIFLLFISFGFSQITKISFENNVLNFGTVKENDGKFEIKLFFSNTGNNPLLIKNVKGSCGCTVPKWPSKPILPKQQKFISITINPENRKGIFDKSITIISNTRPANNIIKIKGNIIPKPKTTEDFFPVNMGGLRFKKKHIPLMNIKHTNKVSLFTEFINTNNELITLKRIDKLEHIKTNFSAESVAPNEKGKMYIHFDAKKKNDWDFTIDTLKFSINDFSQPEYILIVSSTILEDFTNMTDEQKKNAPKLSVSHTNFNFKNSPQGKIIKDKLIFENKGKSNVIIRKIISRCKDISIENNRNKIMPGEKLIYNIYYNPKKRIGIQNKSITFITNAPNNSIIQYNLTGVIKK